MNTKDFASNKDGIRDAVWQDVNGRVRVGDMEVEVHCDSSQLDEALRKMDLLIEKAERASQLGVLPAGMLLAAFGTTRIDLGVTRRHLLGLGWLDKR